MKVKVAFFHHLIWVRIRVRVRARVRVRVLGVERAYLPRARVWVGFWCVCCLWVGGVVGLGLGLGFG